MKKFIYNLRMFFGEDGWRELVYFCICVVVSTLIQSLLFWVGDLPFLKRFDLWGLGCGIILDVILGVFVLVWSWVIFKRPDTFPLIPETPPAVSKETFIVTIICSLIAAYICTVFYFQWLLFGLSLVLIVACGLKLIRDMNIVGNPEIVSFAIGIPLAYCVGAYFALLTVGREPAMDAYGITILSIACFAVWMYPALEELDII